MRGTILKLGMIMLLTSFFAFYFTGQVLAKNNIPVVDPAIKEVKVNFDDENIIIIGEGFGGDGGIIVNLGTLGSLPIISRDPTILIVGFPFNGLPPGSYLLTVMTDKAIATHDVTIGAVGPKGDQGDVGPKGDQGDKGDKGDKGDQGIQGVKGDKGDKGDQGIQGDKGDKGDTGDQGIQGEKGDKGDPGEPADMELINELQAKVDSLALKAGCGDGNTDTGLGEQCDFGGGTFFDGCTEFCKWPVCGVTVNCTTGCDPLIPSTCQCDLFDKTTCPNEGEGCYLGSVENVTFTACIDEGTGVTGDSCKFTNDCATGFFCSGIGCLKYCIVTLGGCEVNEKCTPFLDFPKLGVCQPL